jgi:predicted DNA-binding transcriptional regulator YafY
MTFDEICHRAAGRRAYNKRRRLARQTRISAILSLLDEYELTGRQVAALFGVHEATASRDLKFIRKLKAEYLRMQKGLNLPRYELTAQSFRWREKPFGWELSLHILHGIRIR